VRGAPLGLAPELLSVLACPADDHGALSVDEAAGRLVCTACGRSYDVTDGIPVLLLDQATPPEAGAPC